jgi:UTP-glucose-1-phosphate uridylyltransferase
MAEMPLRSHAIEDDDETKQIIHKPKPKTGQSRAAVLGGWLLSTRICVCAVGG